MPFPLGLKIDEKKIGAHLQKWETFQKVFHRSSILKLRQSEKLITFFISMAKSLLDLNKSDVSPI